MPSTFTSNGGIELPADGEKDGVWGDVVNLNMQIVDRLTNGVGAVSLTGASSTLVTSDGTLNDGQYKVVVFGGLPSGTHTVTIQPDDAQKIYFVKNETAEDVVMTQGSGGNATVAAGSGAIVYANGAGTGSTVVDLTAVFVPSLAQAGVTASVAELNLLGGVTASTAELNYIGGVTSAIQTQINAKQATITGGATTIVSDDLAVSRALVSDGSGKVAVSNVTAAELNILDGVTATAAELNFVGGVTSNVQTQLDLKAALASPALTGAPTAPTATAGTDTTQLATTAFVQSAVGGASSAQATTSGNTVTYSSIPAGVTELTVQFNGVDINNTDNIFLTLGTSGGIVTTGYNTNRGEFGASTQDTTSGSTSAFVIDRGGSGVAVTGSITFRRSDTTSNIWIGNGTFFSSFLDKFTFCIGASPDLGAELDRVRLQAASGVNLFEAGSFRVFWRF